MSEQTKEPFVSAVTERPLLPLHQKDLIRLLIADLAEAIIGFHSDLLQTLRYKENQFQNFALIIFSFKN